MDLKIKQYINNNRAVLAGAALVAACALVPFLPALRAPFIFDDYNTVVQNPAIHAVNLDSFFSDPTTFSVKPGNWPYRPLTTAFNALLYHIAPARPAAWHAAQILLHIIASVLVLLAARRAFGLKLGAVIAGVVFACAPVQAQAVAYISARSMVGAAGPGLFAVVCLAGTGAGSDRARTWWTAGGILASGMAFFSSEGSLALPLWLAAAWYASGRPLSDRWARYLIAGAVGFAAAYLLARWATSHGPLLSAHPRIAPSFSRTESVSLQLMYPFAVVKLLFWPLGLSILHYPRAAAALVDIRMIAPAGGLLMLLSLISITRKRRPLAGGLAWYAGSLLPAVLVPLNIVWAEHRSYLALPGLAIALGAALEDVMAWLGPGRRRTAAWAGLAAVVLLWGAGSWERSRVWTSAERLFRDAAMKSPDYDVPWNFLAEERRQRLDYRNALRYLDRAIKLNPGFADAHSARSAALMALGRYAEAERSAARAVELDPANATYWQNWAMTIAAQGRLKDAEAALLEAVERLADNDPNRELILRNLARLREDMKR